MLQLTEDFKYKLSAPNYVATNVRCPQAFGHIVCIKNDWSALYIKINV